MPAASGSRVDAYENLVHGVNPEHLRRLRLEDPVDLLYLEEVVARSESAELGRATLLRLRIDLLRVRGRHAPALFAGGKVLLPAVTLLDRPLRSPF
jgi:hypothetical protein